jgi:divalent metal cation (Fe/Co/Zn/Cd) transporter
MQEFFLESPYLLAASGLVVVLASLVFWTQTGQRTGIYVAVITSAITVALVLVNLQVETNREQILRTIDEVAAALRTNDFERVYSYIHPGAAAGVMHAKSELPKYRFSEARRTRLNSIEINRAASPVSAIAEFNVLVGIEAEGQKFRVPRFVRVYFVQQGDRWLVRDYEHFEPTAGFRNADIP